MENSNVQDTQNEGLEPSQAFEPPVDGSAEELSVDDIILGTVDDSASAFGAPENMTEEVPEAPKNDDTRYEYWQSQAAKKDNELNQMKAQQQQAMAMQQQQMMQQQQAQAQPAPEQFPDPPAKPKKPRNFSREEAYSDSSSESARYLDDVDEWRDNIEEYRDLKGQYNRAKVQERAKKVQQAKIMQDKQRQHYMQTRAQLEQVGQAVQQKYGLNPQQAASFIKDMSNDNSLTMDNLVQLWRMRQGQGAPQGNPVPTNPSPAFQQTKRAQQIPSPMGVMPGTGAQAKGTTEDQIMDKMISDLDSKNPFK